MTESDYREFWEKIYRGYRTLLGISYALIFISK
jgi:hypothetical protein